MTDRLESRAVAYIEKAIDQTVRKVATAPGNRNDQLNLSAFSFGRMIAAGWISEEMASIKLTEAAELCGLLKDDGPRQVAATIKSGIAKGRLADPARLPEELVGVDLSGYNIRPLSPEAVAEAMAVEERRRVLLEREMAEAEQRLSSEDYFIRVADALQRQSDAMRELGRRGIDLETATAFGVGYDLFPLADAPPDRYGPPGRRPSLVLPWDSLRRPGGLDAVQYRHLDGGSPKVHWHHDLHSAEVFNPKALTHPHDTDLFVVEGALNALTLVSAGITSVVALPTIHPGSARVDSLAEMMRPFDRVRWLCDLGAYPLWREFAAKVPNGRGRAVALPMDPDEYLLSVGSVDRFMAAVSSR